MGMTPIFSRAMGSPLRAALYPWRFLTLCGPAIRVGRRPVKEVTMQLMHGFQALEQVPVERITDKISRRTLTGERAMIVWWSIKAGSHAAAHRHPHEQIFWMLSG